jgi:hypothetical protein
VDPSIRPPLGARTSPVNSSSGSVVDFVKVGRDGDLDLGSFVCIKDDLGGHLCL